MRRSNLYLCMFIITSSILAACGLEDVVERGESCPPKTDTSGGTLAYIGTMECTAATAATHCDSNYTDSFKYGVCPAKYSKCQKDAESNWFCTNTTCANGAFSCTRGQNETYCADPSSKETCGITAACDDGMKCGDSQECHFDETSKKYACLCPADSTICGTECIHPESKMSCGASCENKAGKVCSDEESCVKDADGKYDCILGCAKGQFRCFDNNGKQYCADPQSMNTCGINEDCSGGNKCGEEQNCVAQADAPNVWVCKCPGQAVTCGSSCLLPYKSETCGATCDNPLGTSCDNDEVCTITPNGGYSCQRNCTDETILCNLPVINEDGSILHDANNNIVREATCADPKSKEYCGIQADCASYVTCGEDQVCTHPKDDNGNDLPGYICSCDDNLINCGTRCIDPTSNESCGITCTPGSTGTICNAEAGFICQAQTTGSDDTLATTYSCECQNGLTKISEIINPDTPNQLSRDPSETTIIHYSCINPLLDKEHCGPELINCGEGRSCNNGECQCDNNGYWCNGKCSKPDDQDACNIDPSCMNGTACKENESCIQINKDTNEYRCILTSCSENEILCTINDKQTCVPKTDINHCGSCLVDCAQKAAFGQKAVSCELAADQSYQCKFECDTENGFRECEGEDEYINTKTNYRHCGECGHACDDGYVCENGECTPSLCSNARYKINPDNEDINNYCLYDMIGDEPICISVDQACGRDCINCADIGLKCQNDECSGDIESCPANTHPLYKEDENHEIIIYKCEKNTDFACAPSNSAANYQLVDCTALLPEHGESVKCDNGICKIICKENYTLTDNQCICPNSYEINAAGNCVKINLITECPAGQHVSNDQRSCIPNTNQACASNRWNGTIDYSAYVHECTSPLVCRNDGTCACPAGSFLSKSNDCIPAACETRTNAEYIKNSFIDTNGNCQINECSHGFTKDDYSCDVPGYFCLSYYHSCKCNHTMCGDSCADLNSDPNNCGKCGTVCPDTYSCNNGKCGCAPGQLLCNGKCVNNDTSNCGKCGNQCKDTFVCTNGTCNCPWGQFECNNKCVVSDNENCGTCGNKCLSPLTCSFNTCSCPYGQFVCDGKCITSDNNNCGKCGNKCPDTYTCTNGICGCAWGQLECDGQCIANDNNNCGKCGNECPTGKSCFNGMCF